MTNSEHIREEDLPLLAVGAVPEPECAAARAHAAECADCGAKLAEALGRAALLAMAVPQERPAATIKAELFARIRSARKEEELHRWPAKLAIAAEETERGRKEGRPTSVIRNVRGWWPWVFAPVAALLLVAAVVEWRENRRLTAELESTNHQLVEMVNERMRAEMLLDVLSAPDTVSVKMAGAPRPEKATGIVRYNPRKGVVLYSAVLPALPADKIYQMWLVPMAGDPISAGVFAPGAQGTRQMWTAEVPLNTPMKTFAVTVEPKGGVPRATGPVVMVGSS